MATLTVAAVTHASRHASGGADPLSPAAIGAKTRVAAPSANQTAAFTLTPWRPWLVDISVSSFAGTLPAAASVPVGTEVVVKIVNAPAAPNLGSTALSVTPAGSDTINGAAGVLSMRYVDMGKTLASDGVSNWTVIGGDFSKLINDQLYRGLSNTQQSAAYTFALTDAGTVVESTSAAAVSFTVPTNSSVAFPVGTLIQVCQYGAGQVTIAPASGVTLRNPSSLTTRAQFSTVVLRQRAVNEWVVAGDTT